MTLLRTGPVMDGEELKDPGGQTFDVINPATGEVIAKEACCSEGDVDRIIASSHAAFTSRAARAPE